VIKLYRKRSKNNLSTQRKFIWTTCYEINDTCYTAQQSSYCMSIIMFTLVKALERVQKLHYN